jgi:hypothetical protein
VPDVKPIWESVFEITLKEDAKDVLIVKFAGPQRGPQLEEDDG